MTSRKPSFYARISFLIMVQVVFAFGALTLVFLTLSEPQESGDRFAKTRQAIHSACEDVVLQFNIESNSIIGDISESVKSEISQTLSTNGVIEAAQLYQIKNGNLIAQQPLFSKDEDASAVLENYITHLDVKDSQWHTNNNETQQKTISNILGSNYLIEFVTINENDSCQAIIAAVADHGMYISSRSHLSYYIWLLFLASVLVSLMTIYLISVRVKQPMVRLLRNLRKTISGDAFYIIEENSDTELSGLVESFNQMTRKLMASHNRLSDYNQQATKMNVELLRSHQFLATLINSSPYPVIATGLDGQILLANDNAISELGYPENQMINLHLIDLLALPSGFDFKEVQDESGHDGFEVRCQRKDLSSFPAFIIASPIGMGETAPEGWLYIMRDISESKNFQDMMIRLDRYYTRGEMAGDIAHDINNFLAILSGNIELMPIILKKNDPEKIAKKLALMKDTVDKIARFADGLMDTSPDKVNLVPSDLNQVIESVIAFVRPVKRLRGIKFTLDLSDKLPLVPLDSPQIQQMITNLISNAGDAICDIEGEKEICISTCLIEIESGKFASIKVSDNGPGVLEDHIESLFEKRFTTRRKGHGIGLVTCRKIIEGHQGEISYSFNEGAVFNCQLPIDPTPVISKDENLVGQPPVSVG